MYKKFNHSNGELSPEKGLEIKDPFFDSIINNVPSRHMSEPLQRFVDEFRTDITATYSDLLTLIEEKIVSEYKLIAEYNGLASSQATMDKIALMAVEQAEQDPLSTLRLTTALTVLILDAEVPEEIHDRILDDPQATWEAVVIAADMLFPANSADQLSGLPSS